MGDTDRQPQNPTLRIRRSLHHSHTNQTPHRRNPLQHPPAQLHLPRDKHPLLTALAHRSYAHMSSIRQIVIVIRVPVECDQGPIGFWATWGHGLRDGLGVGFWVEGRVVRHGLVEVWLPAHFEPLLYSFQSQFNSKSDWNVEGWNVGERSSCSGIPLWAGFLVGVLMSCKRPLLL